MDGFLHKYFLNNNSSILHKWIHYFDIYEQHFSRFRNKSPVVLEIGVGSGGSSQMWKQFFGEGSKIIGIDINPDCKQYADEGIEIYIGSQSDDTLLEMLSQKYCFDIIIDDGSHLSHDMIKTFEFFYDKLSKNGVYLVEDCHACYMAEWGGGVNLSGSFMEYVKLKIDEINALYTSGAIQVSSFTTNTKSINVYDSIVVFEKKPQGARQAYRTKGMLN